MCRRGLTRIARSRDTIFKNPHFPLRFWGKTCFCPNKWRQQAKRVSMIVNNLGPRVVFARPLQEQLKIAAKTGVSDLIGSTVEAYDESISDYDPDADIRVSRFDRAEAAFSRADGKAAELMEIARRVGEPAPTPPVPSDPAPVPDPKE